MRKQRLLFAVAVLFLAGIGSLLPGFSPRQPAESRALGHGSPDALATVYQRWKTAYEEGGGDAARLRLPLGHSGALSEKTTTARGLLDLNLMDGSVTVTVRGLEPGGYDVWLVDNKPGNGRTVKPEPGDGFVKLGGLEASGDEASLRSRLDPDPLSGFTLDLVAVTRRGLYPDQGLVIAGAPGLLQQLYYAEKPWPMAALGEVAGPPATVGSAFDLLLPKPVYAKGGKTDLAGLLGEQIATGRKLFLRETFGGNGRTCSTCHRLDNNHTIDPKYIAKLPPNDPLFVAEFDPNLRDLENPALMRQFGLVLTNVDGFDKPGVLRSVSHTLALAQSIATELKSMGGEFEQDAAFVHALGWSGDGSVGSGSLREFALGAIPQHLTKTLNRVPGVDFRLPTDEELTAIEAYLLALGRSKDYDLAKLTFTSPVVQRGKLLFDTKQNPVVNGKVVQGETANCNGCHQNAGAISSTTAANPTRDTGVENMPDQAARLTDATIPVDGGFGRDERKNCGPKYDQTCSGDARFNTPTLIEAADTAPFFHNNSIGTIEEAVASYNGDAFNRSPGALTSSGKDRTIKLESSRVTAVALFLRSINAVENIRQSNKLDRQAIQLRAPDSGEVIDLARAETEDAIEVLEGGVLSPYPEAVAALKDALDLETRARKTIGDRRQVLLQKAIDRKLQAQGLIVVCDPTAVGPVTDPNRVYSCDELG